MNNLINLQLYSLRKEIEANPEEIVRKVPSLGYVGIELAGNYGWSADKWNTILRETGLSVVGAHMGLLALEKEFDTQVAFHKAINNPRLIVPALPKEMRDLAGFHDAAKRLNVLAAETKKKGFQFLYHNHAWEYEAVDGKITGMDILMNETDPALVKFEFDTYWLEKANLNAVEYLKKNEARTGMIHAKELRKKDGQDVAAGTGDVDFKTIIPMARQKNWTIVVEYEADNALKTVEESARYLRNL